MAKNPLMLSRLVVSVAALAAQACASNGDGAGAGASSSAAASASRASSGRASHADSKTSSASRTTTGSSARASHTAGGDAGRPPDADAGPAVCNGYEPCGVNPVAAPAGFAIEPAPGISVFNQSTDTSCTDFADCDMWNTHFTPVWNDADNGWNRMGSPFPWPGSRYIIDAAPLRITYVPLHMSAPNDKYVYADGTPETYTDPTTHVSTCYARGPGHLETGSLEDLGGTGNVGFVAFNISVLPGDMGNTGNVSTCQGTGATVALPLTSDETKAATKSAAGGYAYCLLREGHDYYVNVQSHGQVPSTDCAAATCTMGTFAFTNPTTSDGSPFIVDVPCD